VFDCYNIVSNGDLRTAATQLNGLTGTKQGVWDIFDIGRKRDIKNCQVKLEAPPGFEPGIEVSQSSGNFPQITCKVEKFLCHPHRTPEFARIIASATVRPPMR
jgi:hypothetical protein